MSAMRISLRNASMLTAAGGWNARAPPAGQLPLLPRAPLNGQLHNMQHMQQRAQSMRECGCNTRALCK